MERTMTVEAALVAERNGTVRRILSLEGIAWAALTRRKDPETVERIQNEVLSLRARVRAIDRKLRRRSDAA